MSLRDDIIIAVAHAARVQDDRIFLIDNLIADAALITVRKHLAEKLNYSPEIIAEIIAVLES